MAGLEGEELGEGDVVVGEGVGEDLLRDKVVGLDAFERGLEFFGVVDRSEELCGV